MKKNPTLFLIALISGLFIMISCVPVGQTALFRHMKKEADTLIVISPFLEIMANDFRVKTSDTILVERNIDLITSVTSKVLSSKYVLKHIEMPELDMKKIMLIYSELDKSSIENNTTRQQTFFPALKDLDNNQLAIFITLHAEHNTETTAMTYNPVTKTHNYNPAASPKSDLRLFVFNLQTDEIIYYDRFFSRSFSANSPANMETMTKKLLKSLYYK